MLRHRFAFLVLVALSSTALAACSGDPDNPNPSSSGTGGAGGTGGTGSTGGAGGTGGTGGTGGVGGTGGGTVACTDYTTIPQTECDVLAQDCKLPTQSCRPVEGGTGTDCFSSTGVKAAGSPCADTTECQKGMFCINAVCSPACCPANEKQFCGSAKCNIELGFDDASKSWVKVCNFAKTCTLFTPGTCPAGQECHLQDFAQEIAVCALPAGQQSDEGGACMYINACHDSQVCEGNSDVCRYNCLINGWQNKKAGEGGCPQGQTCHPAPPATTYGICGP